jgi:hypothetical protein
VNPLGSLAQSPFTPFEHQQYKSSLLNTPSKRFLNFSNLDTSYPGHHGGQHHFTLNQSAQQQSGGYLGGRGPPDDYMIADPPRTPHCYDSYFELNPTSYQDVLQLESIHVMFDEGSINP